MSLFYFKMNKILKLKILYEPILFYCIIRIANNFFKLYEFMLYEPVLYRNLVYTYNPKIMNENICYK